jgi:S1-C subfamily serine protease
MKILRAIGAVILASLCIGLVSYAEDRWPESQPAWPETLSPYTLATLTSSAQESFKAMQALYATASKGVIKVIAQGRFGRPIIGSGFFISSSGLIATNWHIIANPTLSAVSIQIEDVILGASVLAIDEKADVAILKATEAMSIPHFFTGRAAGDPRVGDSTFGVGYPIPARLSFSRGVVVGLRSAGEVAAAMGKGTKLDHGYRYIQADSAVDSGNIGGPLLDDEGKVLGMCALRHSSGLYGFSIEWKAIADLMATAAKARAMDMGDIQKRAAAVKDEPSPFAPAPTAGMDIIRAFNSTQRKAYCSRCGGKGKVILPETRTRWVTKEVMVGNHVEWRTVPVKYEVDVEKTCPLCRGGLINESPKAAGEAIGKMAQALIWADLQDPAAVRPYWEGMRLLDELAFLDRRYSSEVNQAAAAILSAPQKNVGNPVVFVGRVVDIQTVPNGALLLAVFGNRNQCVVVGCPGRVPALGDQNCQIAGIVYGSAGALPLISAATVEAVHEADWNYRRKHPAPLPPELAELAARKPLTPPPAPGAAASEPESAESSLAHAQMYIQNDMKTQAIAILEKLIEDYPKSEEAASARKLLEQLDPAEYPPKKK